MDPKRVHAYLQAACAGLGFDIGEVWFSANETGTSTVAAIEQIRQDENGNSVARNIKFLQLYTSKSYKNRREDLLRPASEDSPNIDKDNTTQEDLEKHVLSPKLVNAISSTAQVVWANCDETQGLLGRSDMRLQTAVGMPVAMDSEGNMCIVVMFSPRNVKNNMEAMEYLKSLSQGAASTKIPCLLPVIDTNQNRLFYNPKRFNEFQKPCANAKGYLSITNSSSSSASPSNVKEVTEEKDRNDFNDMTAAPKDMYGIPMLPSLFDNAVDPQDKFSSPSTDEIANAFDPATYNLWNSVMHSGVSVNETNPLLQNIPAQATFNVSARDGTGSMGSASTHSSTSSFDLQSAKPYLDPDRKERLEEFTEAFLTMSVFDVADIWVPSPGDGRKIHHVSSVLSDEENHILNYFCQMSQKVVLQSWSGAIGRAYSSGNVVWSTNKNVIFDDIRLSAFETAGISTAMAVPIFSNSGKTPRCVLCCYASMKVDSVSFIQRFVQHALRILWLGLDNMKPQESSGRTLWNDVAPSDLGEMAADLEMQNAFHKKRKRPIQDIPEEEKNEPSSNVQGDDNRSRSSSFSIQLQSLTAPFSSIDVTKKQHVQPEQVVSALAPPPKFPSVATSLGQSITNHSPISQQQAILSLQNHLQHAIQSVAEAQPWTSTHESISNKRAHIDQSNYITTTPSHQYYYNQIPHTTPENSQTHHETQQITGIGALNPIPIHQPLHVTVPVAHQPIHNDLAEPAIFKEDPVVAKSYIESFNALVQTNGSGANQSIIHNQRNDSFYSNPTMEAMPPSLSYHTQSGNTTGVAANSNGIQPDTIGSSNTSASMYCMPVMPDPAQTVTLPPSSSSSVNGKPCRIQGCHEISVSRRPYCARHSGNRSCEYPGCTKCAQGATRFCIAHGGGRRCTFPGCDKGARDKFFCAAHGGGKRCIIEGCKKSAVGGSNKCTSHGGGRRCSVENCKKSAQSSTKFCVKHGGGKKCAYGGCTKVARGRTLYCAGHGGGVRCKLEMCTRIAIGKMQLCRSHGGGSSRKQKATTTKMHNPDYSTILLNQVQTDASTCPVATSATL